MWNNKRFHSLNFELREFFKEKIYKVSLDGGFTCPNRDGTIDTKGCIFCSDVGSGEFAGSRNLSITEQIEDQLKLISNKFPDGKVIAYFQNFTNTYGDVSYLERIYKEALSHPRVVGIAIATRPDCINDEVLELLDKLNQETYLWIELGLQTIDDNTAKIINRGYPLKVFIDTTKKLKDKNIKIVTHLIAGLPHEDRATFLEGVKLLNSLGVWGVKIHLLHIIKDTPLERYYNKNNFNLLEEDEYISLIIKAISLLDESITIHRLTGDGSKDTLIGPLWSLNKRRILNRIDKGLKEQEIIQGCEKKFLN